MPFRFDNMSAFNLGSEKDLLVREADEAFHANDKASCVDVIDRLYDLLDDTLVGFRQDSRPTSSVIVAN